MDEKEREVATKPKGTIAERRDTYKVEGGVYWDTKMKAADDQDRAEVAATVG